VTMLAPMAIAAALVAADSIECTPWGGAPMRGVVTRADACGVVIKIDAGNATVELGWPEVRAISPADPAWSGWIEAGDAIRRGEQRLARGDAALAADAFGRATELLEGASGRCLERVWSQWATALRSCGRANAAALAQVRAMDLAADDALPPWPADLCPAFTEAKEAREAWSAFSGATSASPRAAVWGALLREVAARQAGAEPKTLPKPPRGASKDDAMRRERLVLEQWIDALGEASGTRQRAREALADLLARIETPVRHWCRVAIGQSLLIEARAAKPGSAEARRLALDAAEQFLTVVACDDAAIPMLSATCAALGAQALDAAGDARGATTVRNRLLQEGTSP